MIYHYSKWKELYATRRPINHSSRRQTKTHKFKHQSTQYKHKFSFMRNQTEPNNGLMEMKIIADKINIK